MFSFYLFGVLKYAEKIFSLICIISIIHYLGYFTIPKTVSYLFLLDQVPFFLAGICFYKINSNLASKSTYFILFISLFSAIITDINHLLSYCLFYMVFILAIRKHLTVLKNKVCLFFGGISYSLYLIHQNFGYIIINYAYENNISPWLAIIVALTASTFLAYIVTDFFEKPILISIRNIYSRHQSQSKKTEALL
jgi:peptidoglycan/LPS O-acetylase OafA/YrhL